MRHRHGIMFTLRQHLKAHMLATTVALLSAGAAMAQEGMGQASGPIDIQADEQEFAEDHVVARGRVKVVYGTTTVRAPIATLFRDEAGQPKLAVFTGNPTLTSGTNSIRASKITFVIKEAKIVAEGHAHSEVLSTSLGNNKKGTPAKDGPNKEAGEDELADNPDGEGGEGEDDPSNDKEEKEVKEAKKPAKPAAPQKIVTDSEKQEFEQNTGKFEAHGNVSVTTQGMNVKSSHLRLIYGTDGKAEAVLFTGGVTAKRDTNVTQSDIMTYFLTTQRMQASGHVKSRVVQENAGVPAKGPSPEVDNSNGTISSAPKKGLQFMDLKKKDSEEIVIYSDSQDYNSQNRRVDAEGRVRLYYGSTLGVGPHVTMVSNEFGEAEKVIFTGRSQITQPGRRWIGDRITVMLDGQKVLAEGNTRAIIVKTPGQPGSVPPAPKASPPVVNPPASRLVDDGRNKIQ